MVEESASPAFEKGDRVLLNGWGVGEMHPGGLAQKAKVKAEWLQPIPDQLTAKQTMALGTAGYTAMLCVMALEAHGVTPDKGEIIVTGAGGGVGGVALQLLKTLGYKVVASTGRLAEAEYLKKMGADSILDRNELSAPGKPLGKERWAGAIDSVGSHTLVNVCAQTKYGGTVAACGLAQGMDGATCPTEGSGKSRVSIDVRDLGPSDCTNIKYVSGAPNQNVIVFKDDAWPHPVSVLGLTTVVYSPSTGEIYGADMEINTQHMDPLALADPVAGDAYDFLSVVTHEAGHFLGMAHSDHREATMYASYNPGETFQRVLSPDDIQGICTIYHPDGDRAVFNGKVTAAPQCDPTPRGGYTTECLEPAKCSSMPGAPVSAAPGVLLACVAVAERLRRARTLRRS